MKVIIAGSRDITRRDWVDQAMAEFIKQFGAPTQIVSGGARGADALGVDWAIANKVPFKYFLADWDRYGRLAGHIRNLEMAKYADGLCAIWNGHSRGTANMIHNARTYKLKVYVFLANQLPRQVVPK